MSLINYEDLSDEDADFFNSKGIKCFNRFNIIYLVLLEELSRKIFSTSRSENNDLPIIDSANAEPDINIANAEPDIKRRKVDGDG